MGDEAPRFRQGSRGEEPARLSGSAHRAPPRSGTRAQTSGRPAGPCRRPKMPGGHRPRQAVSGCPSASRTGSAPGAAPPVTSEAPEAASGWRTTASSVRLSLSRLPDNHPSGGPPVLQPAAPGAQAGTQRTGSDSSPRSTTPGRNRGRSPASSIDRNRSRSISSAILPSSRASGAPRQWWIPLPNETC